jgi:hypothetical protein
MSLRFRQALSGLLRKGQVSKVYFPNPAGSVAPNVLPPFAALMLPDFFLYDPGVAINSGAPVYAHQ